MAVSEFAGSTLPLPPTMDDLTQGEGTQALFLWVSIFSKFSFFVLFFLCVVSFPAIFDFYWRIFLDFAPHLAQFYPETRFFNNKNFFLPRRIFFFILHYFVYK